MKLLIAALAATGALAAIQDDFDAFVTEYSKQYSSTEEYEHRLSVFRGNVDYIRAQTARYETGDLSYYLEVNEFADLTNEEFSSRNGYTANPDRKVNAEPTVEEVGALPTSVDWTTKGVVTPVKNQGQCGSCWSFSTTGSIESRSAIATGKLISLSEQQLMDCSDSYGNKGCGGGLMDDAFKYVIATGGLSTEQCDSYQAANEQCGWKADGCTLNDPIKGYHDVAVNSETALMQAVSTGPVSVAVDASGMDWQFYSGGILNPPCGSQLDHGVLAVGYGQQGKAGFWKVKNSWGASWGMEGYLLIARGGSSPAAGTCGIQKDASYPCVKKVGDGTC